MRDSLKNPLHFVGIRQSAPTVKKEEEMRKLFIFTGCIKIFTTPTPLLQNYLAKFYIFSDSQAGVNPASGELKKMWYTHFSSLTHLTVCGKPCGMLDTVPA